LPLVQINLVNTTDNPNTEDAMNQTTEAVSQDFWIALYERMYGTKLSQALAVCAKTLFPDKRKLTELRQDLSEALRRIGDSVKDGTYGNHPYDFEAIGSWVVALPEAAFPPLSARVAKRYGIDEDLRRQRLGISAKQ
jgi:hypothetical protein